MRAIDLSKPYFMDPRAARAYLRIYSQMLARKEAGLPLKPEGEEGEKLRQQSPVYRGLKNVEKRSGERVLIGEDRYGYPAYSAWTLRNGVATVDVIGPIIRYGDFFSSMSGLTSTEAISTQLHQALDHEAVKSIILNFDSPGGEATGISELALYIRQASAQKRVVAYGDGMVCSAAYWLASACDDIVLSPSGIAGSIGTIWAFLDDTKALAMEGYEEIEFVSSQSPKKNPDLKSEEGKAQYQQVVDDMTAVFGDAVAAFRGVTVETVFANYGQGGVMVGQRAQEAGLVDRLGDYESLIVEMASGGQTRTRSGIPATGTAKARISANLRAAKTLSSNRPTILSTTSKPIGGKMDPEEQEDLENEEETGEEPDTSTNAEDSDNEAAETESEAEAEEEEEEDDDLEVDADLTEQALDATPENIARLQSRLAQSQRSLGSQRLKLARQRAQSAKVKRDAFTMSMKGKIAPTARGVFGTLYGALQDGKATPAMLESAMATLPKSKMFEPISANLTEVEAPKSQQTAQAEADVEDAKRYAERRNAKNKSKTVEGEN